MASNVNTDLSYPIADDSDLAEVAWAKVAHIEMQDEIWFTLSGLSAKAKGREDAHRRKAGTPIILHDELGNGPGKEVRVRMRKQLVRTPRVDEDGASTKAGYTYGDTGMVGYEEALSYDDMAVKLGLLKHAVGHNSPDFYNHRNGFDLEQDSEDALREWLVAQTEEAILDAMYEKFPYFVQQQLTETAVAHPRTYYAGGALAQDQLDQTTILSAAEAMRMRSYAINRKLNPLMVERQKCFAVLADTFMCNDLKQDPVFQQQKDANTRGSDNPIISGAIGVYQQLCFHEYERMRVMTSGSNAANVGRMLLLGADAVAVAYGSRPRLVTRNENNYEDRWGRAIRQVFGASRSDFINYGNTTTLNQSSAEWRAWRTAEEFAA